MATYSYQGQDFEAPDDMPLDQVVYTINQSITQQGAISPTQSPAGPTAGVEGVNRPSPSGSSVDPDTLKDNEDYLKSAAVYYQMKNGPQAQLPQSRQELAEFALNEMSWFNYNLPYMAIDAVRIKQATPEQKQAFLHLLDTHDNLKYSWAGAGRAAKAVLSDPTNYVGLSTLGIGAAGKAVGQQVTKAGFKELLRAGVITGIEGAVWAGAQDITRQAAEVNAGGKQSIDYGQAATSAAIGGAAGAVLGAAAVKVSDIAGTMLRRDVKRPLDIEGTPLVHPEAAPKSAAEARAVEASVKPVEAPETIPATTLARDAAKAVPEAPVRPGEAPKVSPAEGITSKATSGELPGVANPVIQAINRVAQDSGLRVLPRTQADLAATTREAVQELIKFSPRQIEQATEELRRGLVPPEQRELIAEAVKGATERLWKQTNDLDKEMSMTTDPVEKLRLNKVLRELEQVRDRLMITDQAFRTQEGVGLAKYVGTFNVKDNWDNNIPSILQRMNIDPAKATPEQIDDARNHAYQVYRAYTEMAEKMPVIENYNRAIQQSWANGDLANMVQLMKERSVHRDALVEAQAAYEGLTFKSADIGHSLIQKTTEYLISTVFSPATLIVNTVPSLVKTLYRPALDMVVRGADTTALKQMSATYGAMTSSVGTAFRAARAAFEYERSMMHLYDKDSGSKLFDGHSPAIEGMKGRVLRLFPRIVSATDEFFSQIHYRGFVAGNAAGEAMEGGIKMGLKGKELDAFVEKEVKRQVEQSFSTPDVPRAMDFLREQGAKRGYTGAALDDFVIQHLKRDSNLFSTATNQYAKDFTDDILFKRAFSGEGGASKIAQTYERVVNEWPLLRLFGQLFFRTPVRVFEEGFRLTPGLNLVTPNFMADLMGKRGEAAQVRAQGEALLSYAIAGSVFSLYAQGRITGAGDSDFKKRRGLEDSQKFDPYTIKFNDGSTFSFRNLDPFATPLKIIVNALDRYSVLATRQAQGELVDKEMKTVEATVGAATGAIMQAVRDANLTQGVSEIMQFFEALGDPERNESKYQRFAGQKLSLLVPAVAKKAITNMDGQNVMNDPVKAMDYFWSAIDPSDQAIPKQYTALGRVRESSNPLAALTAFNYEGAEDKTKGWDAKELFVQQKLAEIQQLTGKSFTAPYKVSEKGFEGVDLRTVKSADGVTSLYDAWMKKFRQIGGVETMYTALSAATSANAPVGTQSVNGPLAQVANETLSNLRKAAFLMMIQENEEMSAKRINYLRTDYPAKLMNRGVPVPHSMQ